MWPKWVFDEAALIINKLDLTQVVPAKANILRFTELDPSKVRLVIIGQDPYPQRGVANGYAFAVNKGSSLPGSLKTLFKEIKRIKGHLYTDETLALWIEQGVLLLNMALTTKVGEPGAHRALWSSYTEKLAGWLSITYPNLVWVLWGNNAQALASKIKGEVLRDAHPSPLSAHLRRGEPFISIDWISW